MTRRGRPRVEITLTGTERQQLQSWARRHSTAQNLAMRCKIILLCEASAMTGRQVADRVGCNPATVSKWRKRFVEHGLDGLVDEPRPGAARTIGDDTVERFHFHFTPTYGSWMNLVERWFSALTTGKLQRSAHDSVTALAADIVQWVQTWNEDPTPFIWHKTADEILERLGRYCAALSNTDFVDGSA